MRFCTGTLLGRLGFGILEIVCQALWEKDSLLFFREQEMEQASSLKIAGKNMQRLRH
jgi:hypothetical protein